MKKCAGFDMNILCYTPEPPVVEYIQAIQQTMDLRHRLGISKEKTWIKISTLEERYNRQISSACMFPCCGRKTAPILHITSSMKNPA